MPRLLPRLIEEVQRAKAKTKHNTKAFNAQRKLGVSGSKPTSTGPVNLSRTSFSFRGRKKSILLDKFNPVLHQEYFSYQRLNKRPVLNLSQRANGGNDEYMSLAERGLSSNPYHFMIRLTILQVSSSRINRSYAALFPKGRGHHCERNNNYGRGYYILCYKHALEACISGEKKLRRVPYQIKIHSLLAEQIGHQLRNRVLRELDLLAERLRCSPQKAREVPILRKLTRIEWEEVKVSGRISQPGAVAVLIVPPVQKSTLSQIQERDFKGLPLHPLSKLYLCCNTPIPDSSPALHTLQPLNMVPLYNSVALFPSPHLRHQLRQRLQALLTVERKARWRETPTNSHGNLEMKSSHAYILFSDHHTIQRSDSTSLAIALWRLRLWEGQGWDASNGHYNGWVAN
ncbi:hypothetical protein Clacol_001486 [Clathrus columnatus]|uniref:Uncharacterized protein n=1 Tax=Clathrus columnatus TaxID=1419009 RepID=A0AAV5A2P2_9AGAM|nr:hypothetical protein Clacol_001486 [Clathrus columnatus]